MSHLGELLSALVDGELSGGELDRANAHMASCGACRVEANALRRLKHELRALGEVHNADGITTRLLAMTSHSSAETIPKFRAAGRRWFATLRTIQIVFSTSSRMSSVFRLASGSPPRRIFSNETSIFKAVSNWPSSS